MDVKVANEVKKHFKVADGTISLTGGSKKWQCIACEKVITGSATKLRAHLLAITGFNVAACKLISKDAQIAIRDVEAEHPFSKARDSSESFGISSSSSSRQPRVADVLKRLNKGEVDLLIAQWMYINGIAFNTVRCISHEGDTMLSLSAQGHLAYTQKQ